MPPPIWNFQELLTLVAFGTQVGFPGSSPAHGEPDLLLREQMCQAELRVTFLGHPSATLRPGCSKVDHLPLLEKPCPLLSGDPFPGLPYLYVCEVSYSFCPCTGFGSTRKAGVSLLISCRNLGWEEILTYQNFFQDRHFLSPLAVKGGLQAHIQPSITR